MTKRVNPDFRPNPDRALYLTGKIEQDAIDSLMPALIKFQSLGIDPITVYIDSPGGSTYHAELIYKMLAAPSLDFPNACRIITVATNVAASAASDLLIAGDYALAYPHSTIVCHGVRRTSDADVITQERALTLARSLAQSNEQFAIQLAHNAISRFLFRFVSIRAEFPKLREKHPNFSEASLFIWSLENRLQPDLLKLAKSAVIQSLENDVLDDNVAQVFKEQKNLDDLPPRQVESILLKCVIDQIVEDHKDEPDWSLYSEGFSKIEGKFAILVDSHASRHTEQIRKLCNRWGEFFLTEQEAVDFSAIEGDKKAAWLFSKTSSRIRSMWFLFVSICRLLQEEDYILSAEDAYWLGLIDEVIGRSDLPSPRTFVEYAPDTE